MQYIHGCWGHSRVQFENHNNIQRTHHIGNWLYQELSVTLISTNVLVQFTLSRLNNAQSTYDYWQEQPVLGERSQLRQARMQPQGQELVLLASLAPIVAPVAMPITNVQL